MKRCSPSSRESGRRPSTSAAPSGCWPTRARSSRSGRLGQRPGDRIRAVQWLPARSDCFGQPPRERRRAHRRRLQQANAPPRSLRPLPHSGAEPGWITPWLCRWRGTRDDEHDPQGRGVDDRVRAGARADFHRSHAAKLRRGREQLRDATVASVGARRLPAADVGGIPPEGGIEAAYRRQLAEAADPAAFRAESRSAHRKRARALGPLSRFQLGDHPPARYAPAGVRVGGKRLPGWRRSPRAWAAGAAIQAVAAPAATTS